jgi:hypothetical protein
MDLGGIGRTRFSFQRIMNATSSNDLLDLLGAPVARVVLCRWGLPIPDLSEAPVHHDANSCHMLW